jgi:ParB/RepB/Spo0J family partition protein
MLIPIANLRLTDANPRKTKAAPADDAKLIASLKAHGQLTSILVKPAAEGGDVFDIIEGGRRYTLARKAGLKELKAELYEGDRTPEEVGTAANQARAQMHPLDEAAVIAHRIAAGEKPADIAVRFGQSERWASQRVKLDGLCDLAKKLLRHNHLTLGGAEALTIVDVKTQEAYLKKARHDWQLEAREIRNQLTRGDLPAGHALFPLELYPAEAIRRDLFSTEVWLTDREKFDELQMAALHAKVEVLKAEGWSDVQLVVNPDYKFRQDNIAVEGRILKADRGRFNAFVEYSSHSGRVEELRGYTTRRELKASEKAAKTGKAKAEDVKPLTCFDHSRTQQEIMGAHLTTGLAAAIAAGDTWLALKTLVEPLLVDEGPAWAGLKGTMPNYIGVNAMVTTKLSHDLAKGLSFPSRAVFDKMSWDEVMPIVRAAALHAMVGLGEPDAEAMKIVKGSNIAWFTYDEGLLTRYRLDQLQDLARHLKVPSQDLKKGQLVKAILDLKEPTTFVPIKVRA